ncbi:protein-L-isoaspartate O-methyltransferase family protein [Flaviflexus huanghaiensis]|uniref:protein-L-isoaspartate O-methyltransferase family protein n=1 Tax=Flaviflexus huanghaiensis TaxID=1111473 RepID=UPI0019D58C24|nr:methyltransferase domain-containing protein [Flaviflexus huanghaiensis]
MSERLRVIEAMRRRDRTRFLPEHARRSAGLDHPISIGHGQTNSQPSTVVDMLVLLDVHPGHHVLDVGSGSGWTTAILGDIVGPDGTVTATEIVPQLAERARTVLKGEDLPWATIHDADPDNLGWPELAPYDRILVSAEASRIPNALVDQLDVGGVMVIPVNGRMLRIVMRADGPDVTEHGLYRFVPLVGS